MFTIHKTHLSAGEPGAELSDGLQEVDVVGADVVLGEADDGAHEGHFSVVVGRHLAHGARQLCHLHLALVVPLQAREHHLALACEAREGRTGSSLGILFS